MNELLQNFIDQFHKNMETAKKSGALSGDEPEIELRRAILIITAEQFAPRSETNKELLANLRYFV